MNISAHSAAVPPPKEEIEWEMRPGGMFVQKREVSDAESSINGPMIKISVAHASSHHEVYLPAQSTFCGEQEVTSPLVPSMRQKATKRKRKGKAAKRSFNNIDMNPMKDAGKEKYSIMAKIAEEKAKIVEERLTESRKKLNEILLKDTFGMSEQQLKDHELFWDVKKMLAHKTGLEPEQQRLFFKGKEKDNDEHLHIEGVEDKSKLLLLEDAASKERKVEETKKHNEMLKAFEAVSLVRAEVDKLSERVSALEVAVDGGTRVSDKEFVVSTELLMRQLLKLDGIEAEGEAKLQRKAEVRRVQNFVDTLDSLKARNSNPLSNIGKAVSVTTQWETFDSGMGSLNAPTSSSSTNVSHDLERFE